MYALLALLGAVAAYCLWRMVEDTACSTGHVTSNRRPRALGWTAAYAAAVSLMVYTQAHGWFLVAAHGGIVLAALVGSGRRAEPIVRRWIYAMLAVAVAFLYWLPTFSLQVRQVQTAFWIPAPDYRDLLLPFQRYAGSPQLFWLLGPLAVWGVRVAWRRGDHLGGGAPRPATFLLPWLLFPVILPFAASLFGSSIFLAKYTIAASVPFALLVAFGFSRGSKSWHVVLAALLVVVVAAQSVEVLRPFYAAPRKDDWRGTVSEIETRAGPGDVVIFHPFFTQIPYDRYRTRTNLIEAPFPKHAGLVTASTLPWMLPDLWRDHEQVWLVLMTFDARKPVLVAALEARFERVERIAMLQIDIYHAEGIRR
jgi:hypothetical protein